MTVAGMQTADTDPERGRPTVYDLRAAKGQRQLLELHVDNAEEAAAAEAAGIDLITCEADTSLPSIRATAPATFIQAGLAHGTVCSPSEGIRRGFDALAAGADAVYFSGGTDIMAAMAREGIPVTGHIGLVPNWATWTNYRAIGKTVEEAAGLYEKLKRIEDAGAWAVEIEVVPVEIAAHLTRSTPMITQGMGCGSACDTQYLFSCDVLGTNAGRLPRHSRRYADLAGELRRLQQMRVDAIAHYIADVRQGAFPAPSNNVELADGVFDAYLTKIGQQ